VQRLLLLLALWATTSLAQTLTKAPTLVKSVEPEPHVTRRDEASGRALEFVGDGRQLLGFQPTPPARASGDHSTRQTAEERLLQLGHHLAPRLVLPPSTAQPSLPLAG
jgi:hypothetical protein